MQNIPQPSSLLQTNSVSVDLSGRNAGQFRYLQTLSKLTGVDIFFKKKRFHPEKVPGTLGTFSSGVDFEFDFLRQQYGE